MITIFEKAMNTQKKEYTHTRQFVKHWFWLLFTYEMIHELKMKRAFEFPETNFQKSKKVNATTHRYNHCVSVVFIIYSFLCGSLVDGQHAHEISFICRWFISIRKGR